MEDSSQKIKELDVDEIDHNLQCDCPFCLPICDSILQSLIAILKFLGFHGGGACPPVPEVCYSGDSDPLSTAVDPPDDEYEEESEYYRRRVPPRPPCSSGGGGQTN